MNSVYLAGGITGLTYNKADDWRTAVAAKLEARGIVAIDPLRGKTYEGKATADGSHHGDMQGHHRVGVGQVVNRRDSWDVRRCDFVLVNVLGAKRVSIGTVLEVGMAYALGKYILLVMESEGNPHDHGMVLDMVSGVVNDLDTAVSIVPSILGV